MVKKLLILLSILIYFIIAYALLDYYNISCVFLHFFGIPCPGCGMTRALISVINMDFLRAIKYNIVIFFMPYVFVYVFFDLKHKVHNILLGIIAVITVINWIIKIIIYI